MPRYLIPIIIVVSIVGVVIFIDISAHSATVSQSGTYHLHIDHTTQAANTQYNQDNAQKQQNGTAAVAGRRFGRLLLLGRSCGGALRTVAGTHIAIHRQAADDRRIIGQIGIIIVAEIRAVAGFAGFTSLRGISIIRGRRIGNPSRIILRRIILPTPIQLRIIIFRTSRRSSSRFGCWPISRRCR